MSVALTKKDLENIKTFRYQTNPLTPFEKMFYEPYWCFIADYCLPDWLAPNALTLLGTVFPLITLITIGYYDPAFSAQVPNWVLFLSWFSDSWYQTIDAIDGKQARRTDNCSPLGQLLDHNLDQFSFTVLMVHVCTSVNVGDNIWKILLLTPGVMSAHYSIEYRTHFTNWHITTVGSIGATEQLLFIQLGTLAAWWSEKSNWVMKEPCPLPFDLPAEYIPNYGEMLVIFAALTGFHYNLTNIYYGYKEAKDKMYAIGCIVPYAQFFVMLFASSYSRYWSAYPLYFVCMNGLYLTYVTAIFNLNSTGRMTYDWKFMEPITFCLILALDYLTSHWYNWDNAIKNAYIAYVVITFIKYLLFMRSVIDQLTTYLGISFLRVKEKKQVKKE